MITQSNTGHGHVVPRADGVKMRCGGPALCAICQMEKQTLDKSLNPTAPVAQVQGEQPEVAALQAEVANLKDLLRYFDEHGATQAWVMRYKQALDVGARPQTCNGKRCGWCKEGAEPCHYAPPAAGVPEGYKWYLVPKEDTDAFNAACSAANDAYLGGVGPCGVFIAGYRAMLAAAPTPPAAGVPEECHCDGQQHLVGGGCPACNFWVDIHQLAFETGTSDPIGTGYWFEMEEFDAFIEKLRPMLAATPTPPASEQQRAVVMPESCRNDLYSEEFRSGWNLCLGELLRLNPRLQPAAPSQGGE